jgi:hypothetical protein
MKRGVNTLTTNMYGMNIGIYASIIYPKDWPVSYALVAGDGIQLLYMPAVLYI